MTMSKTITAFVFTATFVALTGCGGGKFTLRGAGDGASLRGRFSQSVYGFDDKNQLHVLLIEGSVEAPSQVVHVQMYWRPRPGRTPIDAHATNSTIHYIVFTETGAGVYSGAGYLFPQTKTGRDTLAAEVRDASLRLTDASTDFSDRIGLAIAIGGFKARRNDLLTQRLLREIQIRLKDRLGYPLLVWGHEPSDLQTVSSD